MQSFLAGAPGRLAPPRAAGAGRALCAATCGQKRSRPDVAAVSAFQLHAADTGSAEVQTALLSQRIKNLTEPQKVHRTDYACQRGLRIMLGQRTRLLRYVFDQDKNRYFDVVSRLGIRKKKTSPA
jgi:small subunit ribosomal protein S15